MALFIFDKDGTLVRGAGLQDLKLRNPLRPEEQILKPRVFEKMERLRAAGHTIALCSNMSAIALGLISEAEGRRLMENCIAKIGGAAAYRLCGYSPHAPRQLHGQPNPYARDDPCRKPHPGMLLELMAELGFSPEQTYVVGNSKKDRGAAEAAGAHFFNARAFFKTI